VVLFSYGSGLASSMFSLRITKSVREIVEKANIHERLSRRTEVNPKTFSLVMKEREKCFSSLGHGKGNLLEFGISPEGKNEDTRTSESGDGNGNGNENGNKGTWSTRQEIENMKPGTFYLHQVDEGLRRVYKRR
jgi:3-hydroxy-3-methylglutaryl CoA synthase